MGRRKKNPAQLDMLAQLESTAPYVPSSATSKAAAKAVAPALNRLETEVYSAILASGSVGMTDDDIEVRTGLTHQSASARRRTLVLRGSVEDSGRTRTTRHGRPASVWVAVKKGTSE